MRAALREAARWTAGLPVPGDSPAWRRARAGLLDAAILATLAALLREVFA